jgi:PilZ domain
MEPMTQEDTSTPSRPVFQPRATRYETCRHDACLSWEDSSIGHESEAVFPDSSTDPMTRRLFALLLDISQTGASIALDRVPSSGDGVWLRLEGEIVTEWAPAQVVDVTTTTRGPHLVRLAFRQLCPFEILQAAICG